MWRRAVLRSWARAFASKAHAGAEGAIPAELAEQVASRGAGMVALPAAVQAGLEAAASDLSAKALKLHGARLLQRLRHMSRTRHRGGAHPGLREAVAAAEAAADEAGAAARELATRGAAVGRRGNRRQSRTRALRSLAHVAPLPVQEGEVPDLGSYWQSRDLEAVAAVAAADVAPAGAGAAAAPAAAGAAGGGPLYDEAAAVAYAVARLPACYAALQRVLSEVRQLRPEFRPASVLDYGAGPGTATWAAQQAREGRAALRRARARRAGCPAGLPVWHEAPLDVTAVEPAWPMTWLGGVIAEQVQRQHWQGQQGQRAPGATPGRGWADALASLGGSPAPAGDASSSSSPGSGFSSSISSAGDSSGSDAHGASSSDRGSASGWSSGSESEGPAGRAGSAEQAEEEEEEEGAGEPPPPPRVRWQRRLWSERDQAQGARRYDLVVAGYLLGELQGEAERRRLVQTLWQRTAGMLVLVEPGTPRFERPPVQRLAKSLGPGVARTYQDERFSYLVVARGPRPAAAPQPAISGSYLATPEDTEAVVLEGLRARSVPPAPAPLGEGLAVDAAQSVPAAEEDEEGEEREELEELAALDAATRRLVLESIRGGAEADAEEGEDDGEELSAEEQAELEAEIAALLAQQAQRAQHAQGGGRRQRPPAAAPLALAPEFAAAAAAAAAAGVPPARVDWAAAHPVAAVAAAAAGGRWSRVIRTPRKRSGHVVLDLCAAASSQGGEPQKRAGQQREQGRLLRQTVTRGASRRGAGGAAPYRLARRLRWGDAWPAHFQGLFPAAVPPAVPHG
eukprot:scaffold13.g173.t1